jgi:hypothetical protein
VIFHICLEQKSNFIFFQTSRIYLFKNHPKKKKGDAENSSKKTEYSTNGNLLVLRNGMK